MSGEPVIEDTAVNGEVIGPERNTRDLAVADDVLPETLYIMPISSRPYFPGQVQPVAVNMQHWQTTLEAVGKQGHKLLGLAYVHELDPDHVVVGDFPAIGCVSPTSASRVWLSGP